MNLPTAQELKQLFNNEIIKNYEEFNYFYTNNTIYNNIINIELAMPTNSFTQNNFHSFIQLMFEQLIQKIFQEMNNPKKTLTISEETPCNDIVEFEFIEMIKKYNSCIIPFQYISHFILMKNIKIENELISYISSYFANYLGTKIYVTNTKIDKLIFFNDSISDFSRLDIYEMFNPSIIKNMSASVPIIENYETIDLTVNNKKIKRIRKIERIKNNKN